jgi:hypothetical protein
MCHGLPGVPRPFAGLAAGPDGSLYLSANGEGSVLRLAVAARSGAVVGFSAGRTNWGEQ